MEIQRGEIKKFVVRTETFDYSSQTVEFIYDGNLVDYQKSVNIPQPGQVFEVVFVENQADEDLQNGKIYLDYAGSYEAKIYGGTNQFIETQSVFLVFEDPSYTNNIKLYYEQVENIDLQGGIIAPDTINIPGGVELQANIEADNYIFDVFTDGNRERTLDSSVTLAFLDQPNSFVVFLTGINYDEVASKTIRKFFDFNQRSLNPVTEVYDFESGSFGSNWTIDNFYILSDVAHTGTYSAGSNNQGSVLAALQPSFAQNGENIEKIVLYWWEETNQSGHIVRLYDNSDNILLKYETENPQIQITDGNGNRTLFSTDYRRWVRVESLIFYDTFTHITKFSDGQSQATTSGPLERESYGKYIYFYGENGTHCRFDDIELSYFA
jgi:hypothetical protein